MTHSSPTSGASDRLLAELTLEEKASLMSGANFWNSKPVPRLGIPSIMLTDGPHGLRKQGGAADHLGLHASLPATCFPTAATLANSWDVELLKAVGAALGEEAAAERVGVLLGPGLNIKRNPLAGRNFEYFSEDPLLSGRLAGAYIRGVQSLGVAASAKHFAVNSQETHRMSIDEVVDERALHEIHLEGFRLAVVEGDVWTVMSAYNKVNGVFANESRELLDAILRRRWGFDGLVVSDWGGSFDRVAGLVAGNALEMPSTDGVTDREIVRAVEDGRLDEGVLDTRVGELLTLIERTRSASAVPADLDRHHELAIEAARQSIVLLHNRAETLPLRPAAKVAVVGEFAAVPRYQGAGSSLVNPTRVDAPLAALRDAGLDIAGYEPGFRRRDVASARLRRRAVRLAQTADVVLLFVGLDEAAEAEGIDRAHMRLAQNQLALVEELIGIGVPLVVVLAGGAPIELPFADRVDAIVHGYLPGQGGGRAIADVLTGRTNPSGKLAETYPLRYRDVPSSSTFGRTQASVEHRESIYVGYRYYDKIGAPVRYPFGHGLSYTTFAYSDLHADRDSLRLTITNTGERAGAEVVQAYVEAPDAAVGAFRAPRELRGFSKVVLEPGESRTVEIPLAEHAFDAYDAASGVWRTVPGIYAVLAAASSRDIRLRADVEIVGEDWSLESGETPPAYTTGHVDRVDASEYAELLGRPLPPVEWVTGEPLTADDILAQMHRRGGFAGLLYALIITTSRLFALIGRPHASNNVLFALDLRFRSIERMSGGKVDAAMLDGFLLAVNGHFLRGIRDVVRAARARARRTRAARRR